MTDAPGLFGSCPTCGGSGFVPAVLTDPGEDTIGQFHAGASGAPDTERLAALRVYPTGRTRLRVLAALAHVYPDGLTHEALARVTGLPQYTAAPRCTELKQGGWVEDSGDRQLTRYGVPAAVWRLTEHGHREYDRRRA